MGQAGMPDTLRITVEGVGARPLTRAHSRASSTICGGLAALATALSALCCGTAAAQDAGGSAEPTLITAYVSAFWQLDRHEVAALALTLGILCFAVVTAILLVRTRRRLADVEAAARDESIAAKAAIDRAYALLLSEPQMLIAWAASATDEPEIIGRVTGIDAPRRVLAFGTWLDAEAASNM